MRPTSVTTLATAMYFLFGCSDRVELGRRCPQDGTVCSGADAQVAGSARDDAGNNTGERAAAAGSSAAGESTDAAGISAAGNSADPVGLLTGDTLAIESGSRAQFCMGRGPAVRIISNASSGSPIPVCTPGIGRRLFSYGLCSCSDVLLTASSAFAIDSFDSREGAFEAAPAQGGAAVGINGLLVNPATSPVWLRGSVIIAGGGSLQIPEGANFAGDLKTNSTIELLSATFSFARDLWADADINGSREISVGRDVYQTPGHVGAQTLSVGGSLQTRDFVVNPPCACGKDTELDIAAIVARAQLENDNAELGLQPSELSEMLSAGAVPPDLTCGRFALGNVSIPSNTLAKLSGRNALFIAGDLTLNGDFAVDLGTSGELDVFVTGNVLVGTPSQATLVEGLTVAARIGMPERPTALRFYIGGTQPLYINGAITYAAQIYAPRAFVKLTSITITNTYGAIFAGKVESSLFHSIHYDRAILDVGEECMGTPPPACQACKQCPAGLACIDGLCGACGTDADCCEPMVCTTGRCKPLLVSQ